MCFRDRTFCPFSNCNKFSTCPRALTDKVKEEAKQWWGGDGAPIARFSNEPECFEKRWYFNVDTTDD